MSTDLRDRIARPSPDEGPDPSEKPKSSLSFTQVAGGALAAMTAAALGSRLSVAGTVVGAALASVVAAVAGAVYTASLRRTSQHVSSVLKSRGRSGPAVAGAPDPSASPSIGGVTDSPLDDTALDWSLPQNTTTTRATARPRIGWKPVLVGALLMFAIAAVALTGLELATGHALSGGTGTTVGQVAENETKPSSKPAGAASARPRASASPTASASPEATPSSSPTVEPSAAPSPSQTAAPTPAATPTLSSSPRSSSAAPAPASTP